MASDLDDPRFLERLKRRDEAAFNELVRTSQGRVFRVCLRMVGRRDEAEDLAQEVFIAVFRAIETFRGDAKLGTWIYRIASNVTKNRVKYLARRQDGRQGVYDDESAHAADDAGAPDDALDGKRAEARLLEALQGLDEEQRLILVLRDVENLSYEEIREATGLAEGTVKSRLHRARQTLYARVGQGTKGSTS